MPHDSDHYLNCLKTRPVDGKWAEDFCNENDIHTLVKYNFVCEKPKLGKAELFLVPSERTNKSGM